MFIFPQTHLIYIIFILYQDGKTALDYAREEDHSKVVEYLKSAQVRFLILFLLPIFIFSSKSSYYSLTMLTYHISILYSLGCALTVQTEVVFEIFFANFESFYTCVFLIFAFMFYSLHLRIIDPMAEYALSYLCCICCKFCGRNLFEQWR